jgi:hypothetical protein
MLQAKMQLKHVIAKRGLNNVHCNALTISNALLQQTRAMHVYVHAMLVTAVVFTVVFVGSHHALPFPSLQACR